MYAKSIPDVKATLPSESVNLAKILSTASVTPPSVLKTVFAAAMMPRVPLYSLKLRHDLLAHPLAVRQTIVETERARSLLSLLSAAPASTMKIAKVPCSDYKSFAVLWGDAVVQEQNALQMTEQLMGILKAVLLVSVPLSMLHRHDSGSHVRHSELLGQCSVRECTTGVGPSPYVVPRSKKRQVEKQRMFGEICGAGLIACPIGRKGYECIDITSNIESCGGCLGVKREDGDSPAAGVDCTALLNVDSVACINGRCIIESCSGKATYDSTHNICVIVA
ncbi:hypothetical protein QFC22_004646 [Naganishia vaughanmartiniae]|uniref:Uncharacterized protein n=1 Tax=Naganishia vaughanmartiniae TaxID=1424756 RepID=A0ACC2WZT1_9TREE|nr:hypothetical protein QFC22_004646 [Naganishia vaughanmartiniae]